VFDITGVAWAFEFLLCLTPELFDVIRDVSLRVGQVMDARLVSCDQRNWPPKRSQQFMDTYGVKPSIDLNLKGMIVVMKPPGWEVDGKIAQASKGREALDGRFALSSFVKHAFSAEDFPLVHWADFDHGFLHRLDIPSSGLILCGTTMEGYYWLRLQLNTYRMAREYFVVCQGTIKPEHVSKVAVGIGLTEVRVRRSMADTRGKPAETFVKVLSHDLPVLSSRCALGCCTTVAIRIRTGRHHQIRTHMLHVQHPTVADAKYTLSELFLVKMR